MKKLDTDRFTKEERQHFNLSDQIGLINKRKFEERGRLMRDYGVVSYCDADGMSDKLISGYISPLLESHPILICQKVKLPAEKKSYVLFSTERLHADVALKVALAIYEEEFVYFINLSGSYKEVSAYLKKWHLEELRKLSP